MGMGMGIDKGMARARAMYVPRYVDRYISRYEARRRRGKEEEGMRDQGGLCIWRCRRGAGRGVLRVGTKMEMESTRTRGGGGGEGRSRELGLGDLGLGNRQLIGRVNGKKFQRRDSVLTICMQKQQQRAVAAACDVGSSIPNGTSRVGCDLQEQVV